MVAAINDPATEAYYGGQVAAPVFSRVMAAALRLQDVAPDDLVATDPRYLAATGAVQ